MKTIYMVAESDCPFGVEVVKEVSFCMSLSSETKQIVAFNGIKYFDTELGALRYIEELFDSGSKGTYTIVKMYVKNTK